MCNATATATTPAPAASVCNTSTATSTVAPMETDSYDMSSGLDMILANPLLAQRRRSSVRLGRRRSSFLELFKGATTGGSSAAAMEKRRSSFSMLMDSLFTDHEAGGMVSITGGEAGIVPDVLDMVAAECSQQQQHSSAMPLTPAASPEPEPMSPHAHSEEISYADLGASLGAADLQKKIRAIVHVKMETPAGPAVSTAAKAKAKAGAGAGKKRSKPQSEAVRALMPAVVKRGRRNPMLEAATVGMAPEVARLEKNRLSARECRIRKKAYLKNLEKTVAVYADKEKAYLAEIAALRAQVQQLQQA